ncbi:MAG: hypothetical protein NTZ49_00230 [Candidatus Parcubacteria bacterium]|nr:hypothetical protein [Candidatus Parcubacteria bacterium]
MLKKFLVGALIGLFVLTLLPLTASATISSSLVPGTLIRGSSDSIYYYGADGKRYVFPTEKTYKTWFITFDTVIAISNELLGEIPIGGNVTYKPGVKLVKITTDPKVYYVDKEGTLKWVTSESLAKNLWGADWSKKIDDVPDPFFINYKIGEPLENPELTAIPATYSINQDKLISTQPDPTDSQLSKITLTGSISTNTVNLKWTTTNISADQGFKVVWANQPDPVYPGNEYHYLSDPSARSDTWEGLFKGTYYFRVCEYQAGKCGIYSDNMAFIVEDGINTGTKSITAMSETVTDGIKIKWTTNISSPSGFKIVKAEHVNPVYPGDEYHYLSSPSANIDLWSDLAVGTWHFRVCEYLGGSCGVYSNDVIVIIKAATTSTADKSISASAVVYGNSVSLNWTASFTSGQGFKIVKAEHINPIYPGDDYHYLSSSAAKSDVWQGLSAGTYHFRVCEYLGGACGVYSNDLVLTVQ